LAIRSLKAFFMEVDFSALIFYLLHKEVTMRIDVHSELVVPRSSLFEIIGRAGMEMRAVSIRERLREQGDIAARLEDLKSESGAPFIEVPLPKGSEGFRSAVATSKRGDGRIIKESAYFCHGIYSGLFGPPDREDRCSCGWVKTTASKVGMQKFDTIDSALSGSKGTNFYCEICGNLIGREVTARS